MRRYDIFFKCHLQKNTVERFIQEGRKNYEVTKIRRQIPVGKHICRNVRRGEMPNRLDMVH